MKRNISGLVPLVPTIHRVYFLFVFVFSHNSIGELVDELSAKLHKHHKTFITITYTKLDHCVEFMCVYVCLHYGVAMV